MQSLRVKDTVQPATCSFCLRLSGQKAACVYVSKELKEGMGRSSAAI